MKAMGRIVGIWAALTFVGATANAVTPTPTRTPAPAVLFQDDFSGDLSKWEVVTGTWEIIDAQL